jgi:hypothetical protein
MIVDAQAAASEMDALQAEILSEFATPAQEGTETPAPAGTEAEAPAPEDPAEPAAEPETPEAAEPEPTPAETRAQLRLMEREAAVRDREQAAERERGTWETRIRELEAQVARAPDPDTVRESLLSSPAKYLEEALGIPPDQVARLIIAEKLGDQAPPELRAEAERVATSVKVAQLQAQIARQQIQTQAAAAAAAVKGNSAYPTLARAAEVQPAWVQEALLARLPKKPTVGDYETALGAIEREWAAFARAISPPGTADTTAPAPTPEKKTESASAPPKPAAKAPEPQKTNPRPVPPNRWGKRKFDEEGDALEAEILAEFRAQRR